MGNNQPPDIYGCSPFILGDHLLIALVMLLGARRRFVGLGLFIALALIVLAMLFKSGMLPWPFYWSYMG